MSNFVRALALAGFAALVGCGGEPEPVQHRVFRASSGGATQGAIGGTTGNVQLGTAGSTASSTSGTGFTSTAGGSGPSTTGGASSGSASSTLSSGTSSGSSSAASTASSSASSTGTGGTTAGATTGGSSGSSGSAFTAAAHQPFPSVPNNGYAPVLDHPQLVGITYDGYAYQQDMDDYLSWLAGSSWLTQVGADYGVGAGKVAATVHLTDVAPQQIDDTQIQTQLEQLITAGTLPAPGGTLTEPLYVVFFPESTTVTIQGTVSCQYFDGYHSEVRDGRYTFSYAVVTTCPMGSDSATVHELWSAASHEVIEAATDPFPMYAPSWVILDENSPWAYVPGEVGDLCFGQDAQIDGHSAQRIWSNSAAAAGGAPCIPAATGPYFNTSVANSVLDIAPGGSATIDVSGWSNAPTSPWTVNVYVMGTFIPEADWASTTIQNGQSVPLTIHVPANVPAASGSYALLLLTSQHTQLDFNFWPVVVRVP